MANRGDFNAVLPRKTKRMLALQSTGDAHQDGEMRRVMISAHKHFQAVKLGRVQRDDVMPKVKEADLEALAA